LFQRLIAVSGIGPKVALSVLSGIEPPDLVHAIQQLDVARLTSIPGVGRKTAERIVLELKDKMASIAGVAPPLDAAASDGAMRDDLLSALVNLGYHRPAAEKAVDKALHGEPAAGFERALRGALKHLSR
jgi:Holliday junction DNA helicase RuvA